MEMLFATRGNYGATPPGRLRMQASVPTQQPCDESFSDDRHAAEYRRIGCAFPHQSHFSSLLDEIALPRRQCGKAQTFALSGIGASATGVPRPDTADWLAREASPTPGSSGQLASLLRAREFQERSAGLDGRQVRWRAHRCPAAVHTGPISGRVRKARAASPEEHR
jgi:hypothetical protein